jgi:glycosyltransferase involved in cell wall biosynthesis
MKNKKLRVFVLGSCNYQQFPIIDYGGIESSVEHLCTGLHDHFRDDVDFCVMVPKITKKRERKDKYEFKIIEANYIESNDTNIHPYYFALEARQLIERSAIKPDVIWCNGDWSAKAFAGLGIPTICTIQDSGPWVDNKYIHHEDIYYRFISSFLYDLVLKDADKDHFINKVKEKSFWLYTGLNDDEYIYEPNKDDYILWVGGLGWGWCGKGLDKFIEIAKRMPQENFVSYGTGNKEIAQELEKISSEMKNFKFRGALPRDDTHKEAFKKAKMFAMLTTIPEALGRTNIEAVSKGTPVLGSMHGSVPELVNHDNVGFCSNSIDELVNAITYKKFDYKKCYEFALAKYHVKNEIAGLLKFSGNILK